MFRGERFIPAWAGNTRGQSGDYTRLAVHPRVGGEHRIGRFRRRRFPGSSPRGRGTPATAKDAATARRFIPAWAGNTLENALERISGPVHPRVGGEHFRVRSRVGMQSGSSPRGRGTPRKTWNTLGIPRFIPAWAGNTAFPAEKGRKGPVHPRVGGEHLVRSIASRGCAGSSPRGRGTQSGAGFGVGGRRFIPAWAGNTSAFSVTLVPYTVHPRVGGEHFRPEHRYRVELGSSPRGRGTPAAEKGRKNERRFIPAWAGNTDSGLWFLAETSVHPRVGGEHCRSRGKTENRRGSSPRGRGTRMESLTNGSTYRFIPAWAGNTSGAVSAGCCRSVHPRVGGEHERGGRRREGDSGSSPRGRGTRARPGSAAFRRRFIPAWAGNTECLRFRA